MLSEVLVQVQGWAADSLAELNQGSTGSVLQCQLPLLPVSLVDESLNCSAQQLWHIICKPNSAFQSTIHSLSGHSCVQDDHWHQQGQYCMTCWLNIVELQAQQPAPRQVQLQQISLCCRKVFCQERAVCQTSQKQ